MYNKNLIRLAESLVLFPVTMMIPLGNLPNNNSPLVTTPQIVLSQLNKESNDLLVPNQIADQRTKDLESKASSIDAYFKSYNMPLYGLGRKMVEEAEKNDIDWRLIPAISVRESTGGKFACKKVGFNAWGWHSCKSGFKSYDEAIERIALNLGGNNPKTSKYYANKNTYQILQKYNPPSIVPKYAEQVIKIMNDIGEEDKDFGEKEIS